MTPVVPFMAIALAAAIRSLGSTRTGLDTLAGAAAIPFAWLGIHVSAAWYRAIRLLAGWR